MAGLGALPGRYITVTENGKVKSRHTAASKGGPLVLCPMRWRYNFRPFTVQNHHETIMNHEDIHEGIDTYEELWRNVHVERCRTRTSESSVYIQSVVLICVDNSSLLLYFLEGLHVHWSFKQHLWREWWGALRCLLSYVEQFCSLCILDNHSQLHWVSSKEMTRSFLKVGGCWKLPAFMENN